MRPNPEKDVLDRQVGLPEMVLRSTVARDPASILQYIIIHSIPKEKIERASILDLIIEQELAPLIIILRCTCELNLRVIVGSMTQLIMEGRFLSQ